MLKTMCGCGKSNFNGKCGCNSNYDGMKNHLTDEQIKNIRNKFEYNLFTQAFYSSDNDNYSELFGIGKKKNAAASETTASAATAAAIKAATGGVAFKSDASPRKKLDFNKLTNDGMNIFQKVGSLLKGNAPVMTGDYEGTRYEVNANPADNTDKKPEDKKILGMPPAVFYVLIALVVAVVIFILFKVLKPNQNKVNGYGSGN